MFLHKLKLKWTLNRSWKSTCTLPDTTPLHVAQYIQGFLVMLCHLDIFPPPLSSLGAILAQTVMLSWCSLPLMDSSPCDSPVWQKTDADGRLTQNKNGTNTIFSYWLYPWGVGCLHSCPEDMQAPCCVDFEYSDQANDQRLTSDNSTGKRRKSSWRQREKEAALQKTSSAAYLVITVRTVWQMSPVNMMMNIIAAHQSQPTAAADNRPWCCDSLLEDDVAPKKKQNSAAQVKVFENRKWGNCLVNPYLELWRKIPACFLSETLFMECI